MRACKDFRGLKMYYFDRFNLDNAFVLTDIINLLEFAYLKGRVFYIGFYNSNEIL